MSLLEEVRQMETRQAKLKLNRNWSKSALHTGESLLLFGVIALPLSGWLLMVGSLALGGIFYGAGRLADKKIVDEYNSLDEKIAHAVIELREQNSKISQKQEEAKTTIHQSNSKTENKTTETKFIIDETREV